MERDQAQLWAAPFTSSMAALAGLSRPRLRQLVAFGEVTRLFRDVYAPAHLEDDVRLRTDGLRRVLPAGTAASHETAAWLYGVLLAVSPTPLHVTVPPEAADVAPRAGLVPHRSLLPPGDVEEVAGLLATSRVRTAIDLARSRPRADGLVALDALLHTGPCELAAVSDRATEMVGWRGIRAARELVGLAEPLAESPMETRLRLLIVDAGLPRPVAQFVVLDSGGRFVARVDLAYPSIRLAIEYDGVAAHLEPGAFAHERRRQNALIGLGWRLLRFTAGDVYQRPHGVAAEVGAALLLGDQGKVVPDAPKNAASSP